MKERTKKVLFIAAIVLGIIFLYAGFEAYLFITDTSLIKKIQADITSGDSEQALIECENLHYWKTSLCSSLNVAINVSNNPDILPYVCNDIVVEYDGPWWLPMRQKYIDEMESRKRACITTIFSRHGLSQSS